MVFIILLLGRYYWIAALNTAALLAGLAAERGFFVMLPGAWVGRLPVEASY